MLFRRHQEAAETATTGMLAGFALALLALVAAVNAGLALLWRIAVPIADGYPALFFQTNTAVVVLFVLGGCWIETMRLREGGAHVARLAGARPVSASPDVLERRLVNVIHEIALAARVRAPDAWVLPRDASINAFAAGWTADDAVIAVTQGALERLTRAELQGLVGHEIGHIACGDTRLHTRLIGLVWGLQLVHGFGHALAARDAQGRRPASALVGAVLIVLGYAGWLAGRVLQAAVARQREFRADAAAVQYARTLDGIGGVLRKIAGFAPDEGAPRAPASLAHLWVAGIDESSALAVWRRWLATHPPIAERLRRLYGRSVEALPAPPLPPPADTEEPRVDLAPRAPSPSARTASPSAARAAPPRPAGATLARSPDPQDERDALQRAAFWRSRGECHAALLAWLISEDGAAAPWAAWQELAGRRPFVERLRTDWLALGAAARWQVFDALVARTRETPLADRIALVGAARRLAPHGAARLRLMLLRRALRGAAPRRGRLALEDLTPAFAAATALLARVMGPGGPAWAAAVPAAPGQQTKSASPLRACALRRLHPMQGPRASRAWAEAALRGRAAADTALAQCLIVACRLIDTPVPPALARPAAQPRIL